MDQIVVPPYQRQMRRLQEVLVVRFALSYLVLAVVVEAGCYTSDRVLEIQVMSAALGYQILQQQC